MESPCARGSYCYGSHGGGGGCYWFGHHTREALGEPVDVHKNRIPPFTDVVF